MAMKERPNTVSGLIDKRREIAGRIEHTQRLLNDLISDLDHIDATIRIFDPDADLGRAKAYPPRNGAFKGEMLRFVLNALRQAQEPLTSLSIARQVMEGRGLDLGDDRMVITIRKRVGACLWKLGAKGVVTKVPMAGEYKGWQLNRQGEG
jgi:hypothetical protein